LRIAVIRPGELESTLSRVMNSAESGHIVPMLSCLKQSPVAKVSSISGRKHAERRDRKRRKLAPLDERCNDGKEMVLASSVIVLNGNETNGQ